MNNVCTCYISVLSCTVHWSLYLSFVLFCAPQDFGKPRCLVELSGRDLIGVPLKAPLTANPVIYALPMLTILTDKGQ